MERITRKRVPADRYARGPPPEGAPPDADAEGLLVFETEWADYYFHPGNHSEPTRLPASVVRSMDGIVVEKGYRSYERCSFDDVANFEQYEEIVETNLSTNEACPVYSLDLPLETVPEEPHEAERFLRRFDLEVAGAFGLPVVLFVAAAVLFPPATAVVLPFLAPLFVLGAVRLGRPFPTAAYLMLPAAPATFAYRSAVVAHKLETFVAPMLARERGRRVNLLVDFGAAHVDVGAYLRHPGSRAFTRRLHEYWDSPYDDDYRDRVLEFSFGDVDPMYANHSETLGLRYKKLLYELEDTESPSGP